MQIKLNCSKCGVQVTDWLSEIPSSLVNKLSTQELIDQEQMIPLGCYTSINKIIDSDEAFYGAEKNDLLVNIGSMKNVERGGNVNGCCDADGQDGINLFCSKKHAIATELADCWQPNVVYLTLKNVHKEIKA
jgi:hypothetical protein